MDYNLSCPCELLSELPMPIVYLSFHGRMLDDLRLGLSLQDSPGFTRLLLVSYWRFVVYWIYTGCHETDYG